MKLEDVWIEHLGCDTIRFPRDVASPRRKKVGNVDKMIEYVMKRLKKKNLFVSVYSDPSCQMWKFDKIYLDFDSPDIETALKDVRKVCRYLNDMDVFPRTYFTGGKGFALYVDFDPMTLYPDDFRLLVHSLTEKLSLNTLDLAVVGDKRRVSRLPFTINFGNVKRGKPVHFCAPIDPDWSIHRIIFESKRPKIESLNISKTPRNTVLGLFPPDIRTHKPPVYAVYGTKPNGKGLTPRDQEMASQTVAWLMTAAPGLKDGRKRVISFLLVPSLITLGYDTRKIRDFCMRFLRESGIPPMHLSDYRSHIESSIRRNATLGFRPLCAESFFILNPDLCSM